MFGETLHPMKTTTLTAAVSFSLLLGGCGKKATLPGSTLSAAPPVSESAIKAWEDGDTAKAISSFVETDWSSRPLFSASSTLSLSEVQFMALSNAEREAKSAEMMSQLDLLKKLGGAVAQAGRDAASKGDTVEARKHFTSLKQCGMALEGPDCLRIVQLVGQAFKKMGDAELAKIPQ